MLYLILAIASSSMVSLAMRFGESRAKNKISMVFVNYVACTLLAAFYTGFQNLIPLREGIGTAVSLGILGGFFYLGGFLFLQWNISRNGLVLSSTFMKLGILVPTVASMAVFHERPKVTQLIGFAMAIIAILMIQFQKDGVKAKNKMALLSLLLIGGSSDALSKVYEQLGAPELKDQFLLYIFVVAMVLCAALVLYKGQGVCLRDVVFGLLIGIPNYYSARFLLLSLTRLPAVVAYPTCSVGTMIVVISAGCLLFGEKLNDRQKKAMLLILAAIALLNI